MSAERIKQLLIKRKVTGARLAKVKRPTDKTKRRIARNTERIASLTTKLKIAVKRKAPVGKVKPVAAEGKTKEVKTKTKSKRPADAIKKTAAAKKSKPASVGAKKSTGPAKEHKLKGLGKIAENRVHSARKAYTEARLNKSTDPAKLEELKTKYQKAFRSYMQVGKQASQSSEFAPTQTSASQGRYDPIVLAYNHILGVSVPVVTRIRP